MNNHFDQYLNVKDLILKYRPKFILECGAGGGENTRKLLTLKDEVGFRLVVVNDGVQDIPGVEWVNGVSYLEIPKYPGVDLCLIDTDHNFWTLREELKALAGVMPSGGIAILHDTETFGRESGFMSGYYQAKAPYPLEEMQKASAGKGLRNAVEESPDFRILREVPESHGAMALVRL